MTYDNDIGTGGQTSVSALFDSHADAERAVDRLVAAGISMDRIRTMAGAAGTGSGNEGGFWDSLGDLFMPDEDRYSYAEGLSRGGYLVSVSGLDAADYDIAVDILDDDGTVDLDEREATWRSEGWGGYEASPYATGGLAATGQASSDETIPVMEERLRIGKRDTSRGRVRVRAYTVETPVSETVELRDERVELVRQPVDRPAVADQDYLERTLEAEEHREEAVVSKEARVVEEVGLRKTSGSHQETVTDTVRHTEVEVEDERSQLDRDDPSRLRE
ncbi:MAG: DUF2382 domain-containing protein [Alphaproteobacteria bacterium]|nr:DUF2382 domain-containing protein [Alphaproteobacteria bacterium]